MGWRFVGLLCLTVLASCSVAEGRDAGLGCPAGLEACGDGCVDTGADLRHCGGCEAACDLGEVCAEGMCMLSCPGGLTDCAGSCRDLMTDRAACGGCDMPCDPGEICAEGACAPSCQSHLSDCGGVCTDTDHDPAHCGGCEMPCAAEQACLAGQCVTPIAPLTFEEEFISGVTDPAHCAVWDSFRANLSTSYTRVTFSGSRDPTGVACDEPDKVGQLAAALRDGTDVLVDCAGRDWQVCQRSNYEELWIGGGTLCNLSNCPENDSHMARPCFPSSGFWGGIDNETGCAGPSQSMTIVFE